MSFPRTMIVPSDSARERGTRARRRVRARAKVLRPDENIRHAAARPGNPGAGRSGGGERERRRSPSPPSWKTAKCGYTRALFRRGDVKRPRRGIATIGFRVRGERRRRRAGPTSVVERVVAELGARVETPRRKVRLGRDVAGRFPALARGLRRGATENAQKLARERLAPRASQRGGQTVS